MNFKFTNKYTYINFQLILEHFPFVNKAIFVLKMDCDPSPMFYLLFNKQMMSSYIRNTRGGNRD